MRAQEKRSSSRRARSPEGPKPGGHGGAFSPVRFADDQPERPAVSPLELREQGAEDFGGTVVAVCDEDDLAGRDVLFHPVQGPEETPPDGFFRDRLPEPDGDDHCQIGIGHKEEFGRAVRVSGIIPR
ncbi:MAG: hypothetical protein V3T44_06375 [bacterium]